MKKDILSPIVVVVVVYLVIRTASGFLFSGYSVSCRLGNYLCWGNDGLC